MCVEEKEKEYDAFCISGRTVLIATGAKLLDTKYKFYGFNDDVMEIIN